MEVATRTAAYVEVFEAARQAGIPLSRVLLPDLSGARYKLGTSASDYVLPYVLDDKLSKVFRAAALDLAALYARRNADVLGAATADAFSVDDRGLSTSLKPAAYLPPGQLQHPLMRTAMIRAPRTLPGLDSGVLASWWGNEGQGRELLRVWARLLGRACHEMAASESEQTPYYLQFVMLELFGEATSVLREYDIPEASRRELCAAVLLGLHYSHHLVRAQALAAARIEADHLPIVKTLWGSMISPRVSFRSASPLLAMCRFVPVAADPLGAEARKLADVLAGEGPEVARAEIERLLKKDKTAAAAALQQLATSRMLEMLVDCLAVGLPRNSALGKQIRKWMRRPRGIIADLDDRKARKEHQAAFTDAAKQSTQRGDLEMRLQAFAEVCRRHSPGKPDLDLFADKKEAHRLAVESIIADLFDQVVSRATSQALRRFQRRTGAETSRDIREEYREGRVYRFALDDRPLLRKQRTHEAGHFFIDVKDFTQRTNLLKGDVMAEFIRTEFYEPILKITKDEGGGTGVLTSDSSVYLNNLLGDAVSVSGEIRALMRIAKSIRGHLTRYRRVVDARLRESVHEMSPAEQEEARNRSELVAGSFISFGPEATVLTFGGSGSGIRVSISEKINESARGTARSGKVWARVLAMLEYQRQVEGSNKLVLPFRTYVNNFLELPLSPADEAGLRAGLLAGDHARALEAFAVAARRHVADVTGGGDASIRDYLGSGMSLWNAGDALSGEALAAYCDEQPSRIRKAQAMVPVVELEPQILERFAFFEPSLMLMALIDQKGKVEDLFRFAGRVLFKGFEVARPTGIWELLDPEAPVTQMLTLSEAVKKALAE